MKLNFLPFELYVEALILCFVCDAIKQTTNHVAKRLWGLYKDIRMIISLQHKRFVLFSSIWNIFPTLPTLQSYSQFWGPLIRQLLHHTHKVFQFSKAVLNIHWDNTFEKYFLTMEPWQCVWHGHPDNISYTDEGQWNFVLTSTLGGDAKVSSLSELN